MSFSLSILLVLCSFFDRPLISAKTLQDIGEKIPDPAQQEHIEDLCSGSASLTVHIANTVVFVANLVIGIEVYADPYRKNAIICTLLLTIVAVYSLAHVSVRCHLSDIEDREVIKNMTAGDLMRLVQIGYVLIIAIFWGLGYWLSVGAATASTHA